MFGLVNSLRDWLNKAHKVSPYNNLGGTPFHRHWFLIQWGYIAAVFATLFVTMLPIGFGSAPQKSADTIRLQNGRALDVGTTSRIVKS